MRLWRRFEPWSRLFPGFDDHRAAEDQARVGLSSAEVGHYSESPTARKPEALGAAGRRPHEAGGCLRREEEAGSQAEADGGPVVQGRKGGSSQSYSRRPRISFLESLG